MAHKAKRQFSDSTGAYKPGDHYKGAASGSLFEELKKLDLLEEHAGEQAAPAAEVAAEPEAEAAPKAQKKKGK